MMKYVGSWLIKRVCFGRFGSWTKVVVEVLSGFGTRQQSDMVLKTQDLSAHGAEEGPMAKASEAF